MTEFTSQPYHELLNAYVDGELDPSLEQELYEQLAANPELRTTLRQMQSIRSATRNYASAFTPPAQLTERIFSSLGMNAPVAAVTATQSSFIAKLLPLAGKFWFPATLAVVATGVATWFVLNSGNQDAITADAQRSTESRTPAAAVVPTPSTQANTVTEPSGSSSVSFQPRMITKDTKPDANRFDAEDEPFNLDRDRNAGGEAQGAAAADDALKQTRTESDRPAAEPPAAEPRATQVEQTLPAPAALEQDARPSDIAASFEIAPADIRGVEIATGTDIGIPNRMAGIGSLYGLPSLPVGMSLEYRAFSAVSSPTASTTAQSDPLFNNMAVGLFYRIGGESEIGLELGQESFAQRYHGVEGDKRVRYEQNLMSSWLTGVFRHQFTGLAIARSIMPVLTLQAGATFEGWPLFRGTAGAQFSPVQNVKFTLGLEGGTMLYPFQNTWFSTRSVGLTYGVSIGF